jgi:hypothetical protein
MSYGPFSWRNTPTGKEQLVIELANVEKEIAWNEQRLTNLVWGEDDRKQTEDFVADLRQERQRLLGMLGNG